MHQEPPEDATGAAEEAVGAAALDRVLVPVELVVPAELLVPADVVVSAELGVTEELVVLDADEAVVEARVVDAAALAALVPCEVPA